MPLFDGLLQPNAVVRIESLSVGKDATGKTVETYATLTDDVNALVSQTSGARPDEMGNLRNVVSGTMTGEDAGLARADVRFFVKSTSLFALTGIYLYPESASASGSAGDGLIPAFYRVKFSTVRTT